MTQANKKKRPIPQQQSGGVNVGDISGFSGGTFNIAGRDQTVQGDAVQGDKVQGDKVQVVGPLTGDQSEVLYISGDVNTGGGEFVARDKYVSNVTGSTGVAIGRGAQSTVNMGTPPASSPAPAGPFAEIYQFIANRPPNPNLDPDELRDKIQRIEKEASLGERANLDKLQRWLRELQSVAPEVCEMTAYVLARPGAPQPVRSMAKQFM